MKARLRRARVESIAICFLHAYRNPENEKLVAAALEGLGYLCSFARRLPRISRIRANFHHADQRLCRPADGSLPRRAGTRPRHSIAIMQSNGGFMSTREARRHAIRTVLSGPAGGVVGALETARLSGFTRILGFDMGGTSTDVSLSDGQPARNHGSIHRRISGARSDARHPHRRRGRRLHRAHRRRRLAARRPGKRGRRSRSCLLRHRRSAHRHRRARGAGTHLRRSTGRRRDASGCRSAPPRRWTPSRGRAKISRVAAAEGILRVANANMERAIRISVGGARPRSARLRAGRIRRLRRAARLRNRA